MINTIALTLAVDGTLTVASQTASALGIVNENNATTVNIDISAVSSIASYDHQLEVMSPSLNRYFVSATVSGTTVTADLPNSVLEKDGYALVQLRSESSGGIVVKSKCIKMYVEKSVDAFDEGPVNTPWVKATDARLDALEGQVQILLADALDLTDFADVAKLVRAGFGSTYIPIGTQYKVSRTSAITVVMDKIDLSTKLPTSGSAACTVSVSDITTFNSIFGATGATAIQAYYDGSNWRDYDSDTIVDLVSEGAAITGTPASGDRATLTRTSASFTMEAAAHDHYTPANSSVSHLLTLTAEDCVLNALQFCPPQMSWGCTIASLPAGKYKFTAYQNADDSTDADGTYVFTTTQAIPLGGGWRHGNIGKNFSWGGGNASMITSGTITTYAADRSTVIESGITVSVYDANSDSDAVDLGTSSREWVSGYTYVSAYGVMNFSRRSAYGDGSYATSAIRQWLNSDKAKGSWWSPVSAFDLKPSAATSENGFLYGCDDDFVDALQPAQVKYYMHDSDYNLMNDQSASVPLSFGDVDDVAVSGRTITCEDKVYLLSIVEVGLGNSWNDNTAGNTVLDLYNGAANADRIKYYGTTARHWWLRSSNPWYSYFAAFVYTSGTLYGNCAHNSHAVVPACNIG